LYEFSIQILIDTFLNIIKLENEIIKLWVLNREIVAAGEESLWMQTFLIQEKSVRVAHNKNIQTNI
jgi:hypothetical protein